jgi:hypothetical protein
LLDDVVDLLDVVVRRDGTDFEVERISRGEYATLPNKTTQGRTSQYWLNRQIDPVINLWAVPENSTDQLIYYYVRRIEDADSLVDTTDMPFPVFPLHGCRACLLHGDETCAGACSVAEDGV